MKKNGISWWPGSYMSKGGSYTVQRSADGVHFTTVAPVNKPASTGENEYSYEDPSPAKGNNYYRLAYTNAAGKNVYSNIIAIEEVAAVHIYPNPVTNYINIAGINGKTELYITDISGNIKMVANTTNKNFNWNVAALSKGYYILKIEAEGKEVVIKKFYKE